MNPTCRLTAVLLVMAGCASNEGAGESAYRDFDPGPTPAEFRRGETVYNSYCLSCHGRFGRGEGLGPPLLDTLYTPSHLSDQAFHTAVTRGARQRLWSFGAMPPIKPVTAADLAEVLRYVRWLQERGATRLAG
jgi:mono/diheme cytochrome c family protein